MNIETKYFGSMTVEEEKVIRFEKGLPGFQDETDFVLIDFPDNPVFQILQSTKTSPVAFVVASPYHFHKAYAFDLDESIKEALEITKAEHVNVLAILTLRDPFANSTINLQAPLIINGESRKAQQIILSDAYSSRTPLQAEKASVE
ncbi:flagellar assembly factor FliW [Terribacillus halophilus]|uniref:Flagellar assembly factor FliW n=1 Tax=Terribacillus halophilus TaxID=361279 RepID=A0A1G6IZ33_9BACI|nr:flagellar assembly protein FliW [Terribacillus halophilus]SDC11812.1 flagellar assembly factor FliW [Terribacillus halophilus]